MNLFFRFSFFTALTAITALAFLPDYSGLPPIVCVSDLMNHALAFMVLYLLYTLSFCHSVKQKLGIFFLYAVAIEAVQYLLPTRCASFEDIAADSVGILVAYFISVNLPLFRRFGPCR